MKKNILLILFLISLTLNFMTLTKAEEPRKASSYEKGIILNGDKTVIIENQTLHLKGDIIIKDNSKLIVRNSTIIWEITHFVSYVARIYDNGKLIVENSILERGIPINANLWMEGDNPTVILRNSRCTWDILAGKGRLVIESSSVVGANGVFFFGQSDPQVDIQNSQIRWMVVKIAGKEEEVRINGMRPGHVKELTILTREGAKLRINNSSIGGWVIDMDFYYDPSRYNEKHLILKNSILASLWLWFRPGSYIKIEDWGAGHYEYWNLRKNAILKGIKYDLTLINTTIVEFIKLQVLGKAEFNNLSSIQIATWGNSNVFVNNSIITGGLLLRGINESVRVYNSRIFGCDFIMMNASHLAEFGGDVHHVEFKNTSIQRLNVIEIATNYSEVRGEVSLHRYLEDILRWSYGKVAREFPIIILDENGNPLSNAIVSLISPEGRLIANKLTDNDGRVNFTIMFDRNNYNKEWIIQAAKAPLIAIRKIKFLSSTPIILILKEAKAIKTKTIQKTMIATEVVTTTLTTSKLKTLTMVKTKEKSAWITTTLKMKEINNRMILTIAAIALIEFIIIVAIGGEKILKHFKRKRINHPQ